MFVLDCFLLANDARNVDFWDYALCLRGINADKSIMLNVNRSIKRDDTETPEDNTMERTVLFKVWAQMPSINSANRQAGTHIAMFLIKTFSGSRDKYFLIAMKFKIDCKTDSPAKPIKRE